MEEKQSSDYHDVRDIMPTFVYDDDCGFCSWFATQVYRYTGWGVVGFSALTAAERRQLPENYEGQAHVIFENHVASGGAAIEHALTEIGVVPEDVRKTASQVLIYRQLRDKAYREAAARRRTFGRFLSDEEPPTRR